MMEYRSLKRSKEDKRNQYEPEKRPRSEASPTRDRLSPDHAVRQYQLYDQQRLQEQQGSGNQDLQAGPSQPCREVRLFGANIADDLSRQQQEASSRRQAELNLEQRLGQQQGQESTILAQEIDVNSVIRDFLVEFGPMPQGQESTILAQQTEVSQASSSRQQFGWQGQEAFHLAQSHQETRPSSQQDVIDEPMPLEISSDSDNESSHARPLVIRETSHEMHQTDLSRAREKHIKKVIDDIMKTKEKLTRNNIKQYLEDHQLYSTDSVEIAIKHLQEKWSRYQNDSRYNNIIFAINGIKY